LSPPRHRHRHRREPPLFLRDRRELRAHLIELRAGEEPERESDLRQAFVRVLGAQQQPMLGGGGEHAVGLAVLARDEVIDQHADVGLVAPQHEGRLAAHPTRGVHPGDQTLRSGLFISRRAADLAGEKEPGHRLQLERGLELMRQHEVVLDGVAGADHLGALETAHGAHELELNSSGMLDDMPFT
jgi:hypothetical protein